MADGKDYVDVLLTTISWYHHISMLPKIKSSAQRAFYILETTRNGWSRDVMVSKINSGYMNAVGSAITNFSRTLPDYQSYLAQYAFKDPYNLTLKSKYIASLQIKSTTLKFSKYNFINREIYDNITMVKTKEELFL